MTMEWQSVTGFDTILRLSRLPRAEPMWVRASAIVTIEQDISGTGSLLWVDGLDGAVTVKETPEAVLALICGPTPGHKVPR